MSRYAIGAILIVGTCALGGCQIIGPAALQKGRVNYDDVIQQSSKQQVFENLIRVHNNEPTLFLDVTEVDSTLSFATSASAGGSVSAAKGTSNKALTISNASGGTLGGQLTYSETPTIRYAPLLGQPLVQQVAAPISVESLASLFESDWSPAAVLQLAADRLTPRYEDYGAALNAIIELDNYDALVLAAYPSSILAQPGEQNKGNGKASDSGSKSGGSGASLPNDALVLFIAPDHPQIGHRSEGDWQAKALGARRTILHLWIRLLRIYEGTQPRSKNLTSGCYAKQVADFDRCLNDLDINIDDESEKQIAMDFKELPTSIELRTQPIPPIVMEQKSDQFRSAAPFLRTRSALGIMRAAATEDYGVTFVSEDRYQSIRTSAWNGRCAEGRHFYLLPSPAGPDESELPSARCHVATLNDGHLNTENFEEMRAEIKLMSSRSYILVIDGAPPDNAYASFENDGHSYYIDGSDQISKLNFTLLSQFLIMQAVPSQTPPLTPVIPVGGG